jgi:hypothetical protein
MVHTKTLTLRIEPLLAWPLLVLLKPGLFVPLLVLLADVGSRDHQLNPGYQKCIIHPINQSKENPQLAMELRTRSESGFWPCKKVSGRQDSNLRPPHPKCGAITGLRYAPIGYLVIRVNSLIKREKPPSQALRIK